MVAQYQNKRGLGSFLFTFAQRSITHKLEAYNKLTCGASDHEMGPAAISKRSFQR